jgi:hypothetical protein
VGVTDVLPESILTTFEGTFLALEFSLYAPLYKAFHISNRGTAIIRTDLWKTSYHSACQYRGLYGKILTTEWTLFLLEVRDTLLTHHVITLKTLHRILGKFPAYWTLQVVLKLGRQSCISTFVYHS